MSRSAAESHPLNIENYMYRKKPFSKEHDLKESSFKTLGIRVECIKMQRPVIKLETRLECTRSFKKLLDDDPMDYESDYD